MNKNNIVLIGMPGSGKSTIGVLLAKAVGMDFIDTDLVIQKITGKKLQNIINNQGIDYFLKIENDVIYNMNCKNTVIATGGSAVLSEPAMSVVSKTATIVFLDVPLDELKSRIDNITTRGIAMKPGMKIEDVYNERLPLYKKYSDLTVQSFSTEETVNKIVKSLNLILE